MFHMLQHAPLCYQWVAVCVGNSMQHDRDIEPPVAVVPIDDDATRDGLEQILAGLPVLPEMRALTRSLAEGLRISAGLYAVQDLPRARDGGTKKARSELVDLVKRSEALREHILLMHRDALDAVREQNGCDDPMVIARDLGRLSLAADRAYGKLQGAVDKPAGPNGRRRKAAAVTERAASVFKRLTGQEVTVSVREVMRDADHGGKYRDCGAFVDFLGSVFSVLKIDAQPASQARDFLRKNRLKKSRQNSF
jgi:hypothetical protein